jgi:hypothetical protein
MTSTLHYLINKQVCLWSQSSTASVTAWSCLPALTVVSMVILTIVSCHSLVTVVFMVNLPIVSYHFLWVLSPWSYCRSSPAIFLWLSSPWSYCQLSPVIRPTKKHLISAMSSPLRIIQPRMSSRVTLCPSLMNIILLVPCVHSCPSSTQLNVIRSTPPVGLLSSNIYLLPWVLLEPSLFNNTTLISV